MRKVQKTVMLLIVTAFCAVSAPANVLIDSLWGTAEVKRAGQFDWKAAKRGETLYNNDMLRVAADSRARLLWAPNDVIFVHQSSQIRINLLEDKTTDMLSRHITVFFGALYFVVKEALPKGVLKPRDDIKVFTPTAIVSIRGTTFAVEVDKAKGSTTVSTLSGTVLVRNIIRDMSVFLSAPNRTTVEMGSDPKSPVPLQNSDYDSLKKWVPAVLVEKAIDERRASIKQKPDATVKFAEKILVLPLTDISGYRGRWDVGSKTAEWLSQKLAKGRIPAAFDTATGVDPLIYASQKRARYVVTGEVVRFELSQRAKISPDASKYVEYSIAEVGYRVIVIDAVEKKIVIEDSFESKIEDADLGGNSWPQLAKKPFDLKDAAFAATALGRATAHSLGQAAEVVKQYLGL